jgi:hypothetical protein
MKNDKYLICQYEVPKLLYSICFCMCLGKESGQLYSYPCKRWRRKKSCLPYAEIAVSKHGDIETGDMGQY